MKLNRAFSIIATLLLGISIVSCVSEETFDESVTRIEANENQIATVNEQITAITGSITGLESVDTQLKSYITSLNSSAAELQQAISVNAQDIEALEAQLTEEIDAAKLEQLEALKALEEDMTAKLATINLALANLQAKDAELESRITSLKEYVDKELKGAKDWATATFSTIEQYNSTVAIIAEIKADIAAINKAIEDLEAKMSSKIDEAIAGLEQSIKTWVNSQLTAYYTIAQIDAKIALIETAIDESDDAAMAEIEALKTKLSEQKTEITETYKKAISDAITTNNGVIDGKIQAAVDTINQRITDEIAAINLKITDINNRLAGLEASIAEIMNMIQSITVIPTYSDGDVALGEGETSLYFEVLPLEAAKKLESVALTAFSLKSVSTIQTKADVEYKVLPINAVAYEDDLVKVTTTGKDISQDFFNGALSLNAKLSISNGLNSVSTAFFGLKPQGDVEVISLRIAEYKKKMIDRLIIGEEGNIVIRFVDGSSIDMRQHSEVPRLYLDYDGFWSASFDNGHTISRLVDSNDDYIKVVNLESEDILSARLVKSNNGRYILQTYNSSNPSVIIDEVNTLVPVDNENTILSIVENNAKSQVTINAANGQAYSFKKSKIIPTGISILANKIYQSANNTVSVEFRVNPSNASFNYDVASAKCELALDYVGAATKSSYVTSPTNYKLSSVEQAYDNTGAKKEGQYKAYITDCGENTSYDELAALILTINDGLGQTVQISSSPVEIKYSGNLINSFSFLKTDNLSLNEDLNAAIYGNSIIINSTSIQDKNNLVARFTTNGAKVFVGEKEQTSGITTNDFATPVKYTVVSIDGEKNDYTVIVNSSGIPVINITTPNGQAIQSKEDWINETSIAIVNTDGELLESSGKIKGRGNATWSYPKKPYAIKYDKKQSPFGLPENKSWVLLADYCDRSLLRTAYMCAISKAAEFEYTINYKHIDLYLNGQYQGIYLLTDKVEDGKNRIRIDKDGYIIEDDGYYYNEALYFSTDYLHRFFSFKYPDDDGDIVEGDENYTFIKQYMNSLEQAIIVLDSNPSDEEYLDYIDINSCAKYYIASELFATYDPNMYYVLSSKTSKLKMMPMWDAEWSLGLWPLSWGSAPSNMVTNKIWEKKYYFPYLIKSSIFRNEVVAEWERLKTNLGSIIQEISSTESILSGAAYNNYSLWNPSIVQPLNVSFDKWEDEVDYINNFFNERATWLDNYVSNW